MIFCIFISIYAQVYIRFGCRKSGKTFNNNEKHGLFAGTLIPTRKRCAFARNLTVRISDAKRQTFYIKLELFCRKVQPTFSLLRAMSADSAN
jgi:hypothetical protein